jgi:hypothetical protein
MGSGGSLNYIGAPEEWLRLHREASGEIEASDEPSSNASIPGKMGKMQEFGKALVAADQSTETVKRQVGDWGVWVYYGKAIGILSILAAVACVIVTVFTSNFPSEFTKLQFDPISHS